MSRLVLPQLEIEFDPKVDVRQVLVLGGRAPRSSWLRQAASGKTVWAADRGAEACRTAEIKPACVLGDFDSISVEAREWLEGWGVETEQFPTDKDYTDFQLCLSRMKGDLLVTGCWGGRFDHAFSNIFSALWGNEWGADIQVFADESEALIPLRGDSEVELFFDIPPVAVSLLPLSGECENVTIRGVKWELNNVKLTQGRPYAISNVPVDDRISVEIGSGFLGVYCLFDEFGRGF